MKKTILSLAFVLALSGFAAVTHADTKCGDPALSDTNTTFVACGNGSPENVSNVWGGTNSSVPHLQVGQSAVDEGGVASLCPPAVGILGCVDISHTDYYRAKMIETGRQLKVLGISGGMYGYWINLAR